MLEDTRPQIFSELICIFGLSHGTNVWLGNVQELIKKEQATLLEEISTQDRLWMIWFLIYRGVPSKPAFTIMEKVRKGRGLEDDDMKLLRAKQYSRVVYWFLLKD